jgi:glycosyltransferase involved in cell wall biosynthesis
MSHPEDRADVHVRQVALAMLTLVPGGMGGSQTYAAALTAQLSHVEGFDVTAYVAESARGFSEGVTERVVPRLKANPSTRDRIATAASIALRVRSIRRMMADADVVHFPFTVPAPMPQSGQGFVQSLLDVQHLDLPDLFSRAELLYRRRFYEGAARKADAVVTISHFAKERMVELLDLDPDRVFVAHLGVDTDRYTFSDGPRENFVLYPARGWAHKNHKTLIEGVREARKTNPSLTLVLTGGGLDDLGDLPDWVDRRGLVSADELKRLYGTASALVFPSLYEGFGLPPLEAMASGCPVAASDAGSIPEIVGDAAVLFDPHDPSAIAAAIEEAQRRAPALVAAGRKQVARFTWERCRDVHLDAYRFAAERKGR